MPKCEATCHPCYWWHPDEIKFPQCSRNASVEIDGVNLCLSHAGTIAILKLLAKGEIRRLETANPNGPLCQVKDRWKDRIARPRK
jgi:hypothetical protein